MALLRSHDAAIAHFVLWESLLNLNVSIRDPIPSNFRTAHAYVKFYVVMRFLRVCLRTHPVNAAFPL